MDYVDCLMMHSPLKVESLKNEHFHAAIKQLKTEGKLRFAGMSNHGTQWRDAVDPMEKVCLAAAADGRFDVMLFVYNFLQYEPAERILKACKEKSVGVTLMKTNPVGGYLGIQAEMEKLKKEGKKIPGYFPMIMGKLKAKSDQSATWVKKHNLKNPTEIREAAIKYVLKHPAAATVCGSMVNFDEMDEFLRLSGVPITVAEEKKLAAFREGCASLYCRHACGLCEPRCPHNVPVNTIMRYNHYFEAQGRQKHALQKYAGLITSKADKCLDCVGHCESACPYDVPIHGLLTMAHDRLTLT